MFGLMALLLCALVMGLALHQLTWAFVVYPDKVRVRGWRRRIDVPFESIESTRLVLMTKHALSNYAMALLMHANPRRRKLGERAKPGFSFHFEAIEVKLKRNGWVRGYYLEMEGAANFLKTLNQALERYRAIHRKPTPSSAA